MYNRSDESNLMYASEGIFKHVCGPPKYMYLCMLSWNRYVKEGHAVCAIAIFAIFISLVIVNISTNTVNYRCQVVKTVSTALCHMSISFVRV